MRNIIEKSYSSENLLKKSFAKRKKHLLKK